MKYNTGKDSAMIERLRNTTPEARSNPRNFRRIVSPVLLAAVLAGAGCSDDDSSGDSSPITAAPVRGEEIFLNWREVKTVTADDVCDAGAEVEGDPDAEGEFPFYWRKAALLRTKGSEANAVVFASPSDDRENAIVKSSLPIDEEDRFDPDGAYILAARMRVGQESVCFSFGRFVLNDDDSVELTLVPTDIEVTKTDSKATADAPLF